MLDSIVDEVVQRKLLQMRLSQLLLNDLIRMGVFKVPIHLAMGHEVLALALEHVRSHADPLILTHRNLHYQLAMGVSLESLVQEALLEPSGAGAGRRGIMNLDSRKQGNLYTSSILGNNLPVACGVALADRVASATTVTWVVTGDGAMEEGAFAESLLNAASLELPMVFLLEDNDWSLATSVTERRSQIDVASLAHAYGLQYLWTDGGEWSTSLHTLSSARNIARSGAPVLVHARLSTLGGLWVEAPERAEGRRLINYHAGATPESNVTSQKPLSDDDADPLRRIFTEDEAAVLGSHILGELEAELSRLALEVQR